MRTIRNATGYLGKNAVHIWRGNLDDYLIPEWLLDTPVRKDGWPDMRSKEKYRIFMDWVRSEEDKQRNNFSI